VSTAPAFASETDALDMLDSALAYLAAADPAQMPTVIQAQALTALERADARTTAARASILAAFTASQGYCEDADYSPRSWLIHQTRVTKATAADHVGWSRRPRTHPRVMAALAAGDHPVLRPHHLRLDRPASRGLPGQRRRDLGQRRPDGDGAS
jgi:hypothetical protein